MLQTAQSATTVRRKGFHAPFGPAFHRALVRRGWRPRRVGAATLYAAPDRPLLYTLTDAVLRSAR